MFSSKEHEPVEVRQDAAPADGISSDCSKLKFSDTQAATSQLEIREPPNGLQSVSDEARQEFAEREKQFALSLMRVISVLVRSPNYRHCSLADLEWLVLPPLRLGQCAILQAGTPGLPVAAAVALWASVSPEVDLRLSQNLTAPIRLRPDEWRSGHILWLIDIVGPRDAAAGLLARLKQTVFKGCDPKMRRRVAEIESSGESPEVQSNSNKN